MEEGGGGIVHRTQNTYISIIAIGLYLFIKIVHKNINIRFVPKYALLYCDIVYSRIS